MASNFHLTDLGNAQRLVEVHGDKLRFVQEWGWCVFTGDRWQVDKCGAAKRLAKDIIRHLHLEAAEITDSDERKPYAAWAMRSEAAPRIEAMLKLAESEKELVARPENFDQNPMLFNCQNGTLDLTTGELHPHNPADMLTKISPIKYDPEATCYTWESFLDRIMGENQALITFLQKAMGYTLTGEIGEQVFFFCYGTGANGKSVLMSTVANILGEYSRACDFATLLADNQRSSNSSPDLARLAGARLVTAAEPAPGKKFAESMLKNLTGGDTISASYKYKDHFDFIPVLKLWIAANHKPAIIGGDEGIWRRIRLIPFTVTIPPAERDHKLTDKLFDNEAAGILAWMVRGCLEWQKTGLDTPKEVMAATEIYRSETDFLRDFIEDTCITGGGNRSVLVADLYLTYVNWAAGEQEKVCGKRTFIAAMGERGFPCRAGNYNKKYFYGVSLVSQERSNPA